MKKNHKKVVIKNKKRFISSVSLVILMSVILIFALSSLVNNTKKDSLPVSSDEVIEKNNTSKEIQPDRTFTMAVTGDIMCHNTQYQDAYNSSTDSYDFSYVFNDIKNHIESADISVGNLETTFSGYKIGYSGYPTFNTPEVLAKNLKDIGFDVLTTANNHSLDKRYTGIESTIKYLDEADISHTGTFTSEESQNTILTKTVNGIKIAFLSYTYGTNGISVPSGKEYCINLINKDLILKHLALAKEQNPDIICVSMHWGIEYRTTPTDEQKELADFLFKNGADLILGNHPHVLENMEKREIKLDDGSTKEGFVVYSLGNFISGQIKQNTRDSAILNLQITKHGETRKNFY